MVKMHVIICATVVAIVVNGLDLNTDASVLNFDPSSFTLQVNTRQEMAVGLREPLDFPLRVSLLVNRRGYLTFFHGNENFTIPKNSTETFSFILKGTKVTSVAIIGWIYFCAWSVSFYPQIWSNYRRKSVEGLDFNFLALNLMGFSCYSIYNCILFFSPKVKAEYIDAHQFGDIPVDVNDVVFALHALFATLVTIGQCFVYQRGKQRLSWTCVGILCGMALYGIISVIIAGVHEINWLRLIILISYIKLVVTIIKYVPQAWFNYRRKSTVGWSIGNVLLDFTGGTFSILQMMLQAYNFDDWSEIFTDFTKFGLGFFSLLFDVLFMIQHYFLYNGNVPYGKYDDDGQQDPTTVEEDGERGFDNPAAVI